MLTELQNEALNIISHAVRRNSAGSLELTGGRLDDWVIG